MQCLDSLALTAGENAPPMSVTVRSAVLLQFSPVRTTVPISSSLARTRRAGVDARAVGVQVPLWDTVARSAARQDAPAGGLRRVAMALGLGAVLLASTGAAGWAFVAAERTAQSSLSAYVGAPGGRS